MIGRSELALAAIATILLAHGSARADEREQCASAAEQAQQLRDEGKYRRGREQLLVCGRDVCPVAIKRDCLDWLAQLDSLAPTVVFDAKEGTKDLPDVKVFMDGAKILDRLDGRPVAVDLGEHTFRFEHGAAVQEQKVVIGAGQKGRNIAVQFGATSPPGPPTGGATGAGTVGAVGSDHPPDSEPSLTPAFVIGGIGILGLASFVFFGLSGKSDVDHLESTCKPNCAESDVEKARTKLIIADISAGVGVIALGVATYMILTRPKVDVPGSPRALKWDIGPTASGASMSVHGSF